jgi:ParB family chromosome partitioning protein
MDKNSWGTPDSILNVARTLMGSIELDAASNQSAQLVVRADRWFGLDHPDERMRDALTQSWECENLWLNPPYGRGFMLPFVSKLLTELPHVKRACVLVNAVTDTKAGQLLLGRADGVIFLRKRVAFINPETGKTVSGNSHGQMLCLFGDIHAEAEHIQKIGTIR